MNYCPDPDPEFQNVQKSVFGLTCNIIDLPYSHLEPSVNLNGLESIHQGLVNTRLVAMLEPDSQQPQCVLKAVAITQRDGPNEAFYCCHGEVPS